MPLKQTPCPRCGTPKMATAAVCALCRMADRLEAGRQSRLCPTCGREKARKATTATCRDCYEAKRTAAARRVCKCGQPKHPEAEMCRACRAEVVKAAKKKRTTTACACGRTKSRTAPRCWTCYRGTTDASTRVCPKCAGPKSTESKQCGTCRRAEERAAFDQLVEDVEWLIEAREWPERIAERVGQRRDTLVRRLQNNGRSDLANYLDAVNPDEARRAS